MKTSEEKKMIIERTSKRRQRECRNYCEYHYANVKCPITDLYHAYSNPSCHKQNAFDYCRYICSELDGFDFHISSYNSYIFTVVFKFIVDDKMCYAHITPSYDSFCYAES